MDYSDRPPEDLVSVLQDNMPALRESAAMADRGRRLQRQMQRARLEDMMTTGKMLEAMDLFRGPITRSYNFAKEVADDPFGVAARRAAAKASMSANDLFGIGGDSGSRPTAFEAITGEL